MTSRGDFQPQLFYDSVKHPCSKSALSCGLSASTSSHVMNEMQRSPANCKKDKPPSLPLV